MEDDGSTYLMIVLMVLLFGGCALKERFLPEANCVMNAPEKRRSILDLELGQLTHYPRIAGRGTRSRLSLIGNYSFRGFQRYEDVHISGTACVLVDPDDPVHFYNCSFDHLAIYFLGTKGAVTWGADRLEVYGRLSTFSNGAIIIGPPVATSGMRRSSSHPDLSAAARS